MALCSFILSAVFSKSPAHSLSDSLTVFSQFSLSSHIFLMALYIQSVLSAASFRADVFSSAVSLSDSILITSCVARSLPSDFKACTSRIVLQSAILYHIRNKWVKCFYFTSRYSFLAVGTGQPRRSEISQRHRFAASDRSNKFVEISKAPIAFTPREL